jgi:hypothetical protein
MEMRQCCHAGVGRFAAGALLLLLGACAAKPEAPPAPACPATLAYLKPKLVTPWPDLEEFMGKGAMERQLDKPIDEMIADGGGVEASLRSVRQTVADLQETLANKEAFYADGLAAGRSQHQIEVDYMIEQDGLTLNQGFIDAVLCRQAQGQGGAPGKDQSAPPDDSSNGGV